MRGRGWLLGAVVLCGCYRHAFRARAAYELQCPQRYIRARVGDGGVIRAWGCGRSVDLVCHIEVDEDRGDEEVCVRQGVVESDAR